MKETEKIRLGISIGDINGIGCEVALKTFEDARMLDFCTPVLFASNKIVSQQIKDFGLDIKFNGVRDADQALDGKVNIVNISKEVPNLEYGQATKEAGEFAITSLKAAVNALKENKIDVLVTAPINKNNIQSEDFKFPGHTDFLAQELKGESLMFMVTNELRVGLLTDHIAVKDVAKAITPNLIRNKVATMEESLKMDFGIRKPKIALLGINPHSGDNGTIGEEDDKILKPTIKELFNKGTLVYGPYSADSFFGSDNHKNFDAVLAAYHDQGLIPFKTLSFGKGVNYTAGLDKVRTSPDHGTAYEIAGKGKADDSSFKEAVFTAIQVFKHRTEYQELTENPLKKQKIKRGG
ncbi:MAG TPA: 4-hydroxythreonine-4-phosphate dehydrogenase PdxA [Muricauda sp.]|uniref:4-hydroxythreonine-4-phosphate dehydrogenase PdxA n=1 Tax=Flagellimonas aurea TaxID=2915619 RepID=A0ABS3G127_9FLAO|nr:4-hydroxythreonine-4-phosphate dehydrogenase PdxA [Allomuricauda aurea]MAO17999.1 4-hydroxythreonine-4-phosphate dehydrogenase PdxA [Allomuricauda sp.]UBZ15677.1 4-hydroxythreonine-4-phosphate dehydrogenase PdxA [Allomuricauda aquimarina]MBC71097.1 4-hydroxythreonine-4-phosphate dehydrogenase PdxA [Allomuricauda sp.]MBO0352673.1 4-hydroxythreonine-4-phosphate dehydrogenase PdxA [Allomuricauda aurea]HBU77060.1 4-hydroxythreonine-4-phosphate dehydrogenase PdxA [Allomuricauda sp.]|tara:strand:- start:1499 stop:2551 length:1053 start_codon:yes stop_codon:yes gene_type:complete